MSGVVGLLAAAAAHATGANSARDVNPTGGTNANDGIRWLIGSNSQFQAYVSGSGQLYNPSGVPTGAKTTTAGNTSRLFNSVVLRVDGGTHETTRVYHDADNSGQDYTGTYRFAQESQSLVSGQGTAASPWLVTTVLKGRNNAASGDANIVVTIVDSYVLGQAWLTRRVSLSGLPASATVKLYQYMDTYLAGDDRGPGFVRYTEGVSTTVPTMVGVTRGLKLEALAYDQSSGLPLWDRYFTGDYEQPLADICNPGGQGYRCRTGNGNLSNLVDDGQRTDNALAVQWNVPAGSTRFTAQYRIAFGDEQADLDKEFSPGTILRGGVSTLTFTLSNRTTSSASNVGFTDNLPTGVRVAAVPNVRTNCPNGGAALGTALPAGMTVAAQPGGTTISVSGVQLSAATSAGSARVCRVAVDVTSSVVDTHLNASANMSNLSGNLLNLVGDRTLTVVDPPGFGMCDGRMFHSVAGANSTVLSGWSTSSNPLALVDIGQASHVYDALAYRVTDNYLYALRSTTAANPDLLKIGADGQAVVLGPVSGLPGGNVYRAGAANANGEYYVKAAGSNNTIYRIGLDSRVATPVSGGASISVLDIAFVGNELYAVATNGQLYSISTSSGQSTAIGAAGAPATVSALYGSPTGLFGVADDGGLYQFDRLTGARMRIADAAGVAGSDGANCPTAPLGFEADLAITKTDGATSFVPGGQLVYTIVASNSGRFGAYGAVVSDPLPAGISSASWACTATGSGTCTAAGTGSINDLVNLPVGATLTYTLNATVSASFTSDLVNTASVAPGAATIDANMANNSATDIDAPAASDLSLTLSNSATQVTVGQTTTYALIVSNGGPAAAHNARVQDDWVANGSGMDCSTAAGGSLTCPATTGGAACPSPLTPEALQAGLTIPSLPANSSVTLNLTCRVMAP